MLRQFLEWLSSGEKTPADLRAICLQRIEEQEPTLRAWVEIAPEEPAGEGQLHGIPFGVKDTFETLGLSTAFGSPLHAGRRGQCDAGLVTRLRRMGATVLGKTQTTAFAYYDPAPTRNPHGLAHTPGGSSSGSAAAVAAGMVPLALGSQTQGSVLRPASFCGVVGFKPTFGVFSREGLLPFAPSLDTPGCFTQSAADMRIVGDAFGLTHTAPASLTLGVPSEYPDVDQPMRRAFEDTVERLRAGGVRVMAVDVPLLAILEAVRTINHYEGARTMESEWRTHGEGVGRKLAELIERGLALSRDCYEEALSLIEARRREVAATFQEMPLIATPAAPGTAPSGLDSTGDPRLNSPWTGLHVPAVSIPMPVEGLPMGLQLVAAQGRDGYLLAAAERIETLLR
ncbi:MAG: amidase [Bryobacteraceae bacterium]